MAERTVSVKLSANVSSYLAAMASAKAATTGLSSTSRDLTRLGTNLQSLGRTATIGVTVPLLALGAGAVSMAANFDTAFAEMVGLANVPASEVDNLKESVLALAGETAIAPQELAEGLYFAASAGLDSAAAMEVLELAAQASAAGMGPVAGVVNLVTGAISAYGADNITAAEATDVLTAAIREGKAEPSEFAGALGRVTPIAAAMGVSFGEVAGAAAFMSNIIGDTDETITALSGALLAMLDPSAQGRQTLIDMGTSFEELQAAISQDGLLGGLELLREHGFVGNSEAMSNLFEDNRALVGATILLEDATGQLVPTIDAVTNSTGAAGDAFRTIAETDGFQMKQALTDIKVAMIQVGAILLPIVADIATAISGLVGWFTDLNPAVQKAAVAFAGLMVAAGPLTFVAGTLMKNWVSLAAVFGASESAATKVGRALGAMSLIAAGAYAAWQILGEGHLNASAHINTASTALATETVAAIVAATAAGEATTAVDALSVAHLALSEAIAGAADEELSESMARLNVTSDEWLDTLLALEDAQYGSADAQRIFSEAMNFTAPEAAAYFYAIAQGVTDTEELARVTGRSVEEIEAVQEAFNTAQQYALENKDEINALALTYLDLQASLPGVASETLAVAEGIAGSRIEAGNAVDVYEEYVRQLLLLPPAERDAALGSDEMQAALAALPPELQALIDGSIGAADAIEELATVQASAIDTTSDFQDYLSDVEHILSEYSGAIETAVAPHRNLENAIDDVFAASGDFAGQINTAEGALDLFTEGIDRGSAAGRENRDLIQGWADDIISMSQAQLEAGVAVDQVTEDYAANREELLDAAEAAGLNRDEVEAMIDTYGLVPDLIVTSIQLANDALAKWRIDRYLEKLDEVPEDVAVAIETAIDAGDWAEANRLLNSIPDPSVRVRVQFPSLPRIIPIGNGAVGYDFTGGSGAIAVAGGGYFDRPTFPTLIGEAGPEVVLPLNDPGRMAALLGMSQVGPKVAAAFGNLMPYYAPSGGGNTSTSSMNVVVNMPPGANGDDVVRALKQWQRRSGPLPLSIR